MTALTNAVRNTVGLHSLPTGTLVEVDSLPQMDIIRLREEINRTNHHVYVLGKEIGDLVEKLEQIEKVKIAQFKDNDVYEVNKHIERLEARIAMIDSHLFDSWLMRWLLR